MMEKMHVFLDGEFVPEERALIPVTDRLVLYGDGLFETLPCYNGKPFRLADHLNRLEAGLKLARIALPCPAADLREPAQRLIELNGLRDAVLRITVSRGSSARGYSPASAKTPRVIITTHPPAAPKRQWRLVTSSFRVLAGDPLAGMKSGSRLRSVLARAEAEDRGADEALLLNERGEMTEGVASNLFLIDSESVCTPPLSAGVLPGITRGIVLDLCRQAGLAAAERNITPNAVADSAGAFMTVSTMGLIEAISLDGAELRRSPLFAKLHSAYWDLVRHETGRQAFDEPKF